MILAFGTRIFGLYLMVNKVLYFPLTADLNSQVYFFISDFYVIGHTDDDTTDVDTTVFGAFVFTKYSEIVSYYFF